MGFDIDINFLCEHYIYKKYEELTENTKEEYKQMYIYPLFDEIRKEIDFKEKLNEYVRDVLQFTGDEFLLDVPVLRGFSDWMFEFYYKQQPTYLNIIAKKEHQQALEKMIEEYRNVKTYFVINKEDLKIYDSDFGKHWRTIVEILSEKFGKEYVRDVNNWNFLDKYIKENLILFGNWNCAESYTFHNNGILAQVYTR